MEEKKNRYGFIDAIRGLAAMAVVIEHASENWLHNTSHWPTEVFSFGMFGVVSFLFVSGFVVPFSLERSKSLKAFWKGRFFRLYPLYWFSILVMVPILLGSPPIDGFDPSNFWHWLINFTMLQQFVGVGHAQNSYWTLTLELVLYATFSVLFLMGFLRKSLLIGWLVAGMSLLVGALVPLALHHRLPGGSSGGYIMCYLTAFVGIVAFRFFRGEATLKAAAAYAAASYLVGLSICVVLYLRLRSPSVPISFEAAVLSWSAAYAFLLIMMLLRNREMPVALTFLGRISYSIYLLHRIPMTFLPEKIPGVVYVLLVCIFSAGISALTYYVIEAPAERFGKRMHPKAKALPEAI